MCLKTTMGPLLLVASGLAGAASGPPPLDLNDVSWLWPVPQTAKDVHALISMDDLLDASGQPVWSDKQFAQTVAVANSDKTLVKGKIRRGGSDRVFSEQIGFDDSFGSDKGLWRIAAMRADPSAPGADPAVRKALGGKPQLRLVVQPVTIDGRGQVEVHDVALHLVYSFLTKSDDGKPVQDEARFQTIVDDLVALKLMSADQGVVTDGPLGVHPGLDADVPGLRKAVGDFLSRHLSATRLDNIGMMGLPKGAPEPWIFLPLTVGEDGVDVLKLGPLTASAQMLSAKERPMFVAPVLPVDNLQPPNPVPALLLKPHQRRGVATAALFQETLPDLDAPAQTGIDQNQAPLFDPPIRNRDIPDLIANPRRSTVFNADCVSCHTETQLRLEHQLKPDGKGMGVEMAAIDPAAIAANPWNVRNFGWFPDFFPPRETFPSVTQRTANETLEVVRFIDEHYRADRRSAQASTAGR